MSWKDKFIERYGEAEYERRLESNRQWRGEHQEELITNNQEKDRKGDKYYEKMLEYNRTGLQHERNRIRARHGHRRRDYKKIIAPDSQLHHEWIPKTSEYNGVALVEKEPHQYGIIDVIEIVDGKITLLTEKEIRQQG